MLHLTHLLNGNTPVFFINVDCPPPTSMQPIQELKGPKAIVLYTVLSSELVDRAWNAVLKGENAALICDEGRNVVINNTLYSLYPATDFSFATKLANYHYLPHGIALYPYTDNLAFILNYMVHQHNINTPPTALKFECVHYGNNNHITLQERAPGYTEAFYLILNEHKIDPNQIKIVLIGGKYPPELKDKAVLFVPYPPLKSPPLGVSEETPQFKIEDLLEEAAQAKLIENQPNGALVESFAKISII